ncbi:MAG: hypothetical protein P4L95_18060 [Rouxiella aceris]|uniref:hypothetical protein n=1 Tax=Rouxiella aceris TaxID=2703884 RepID=UPI00284C0D85|nr:hypothetical protein [Rouxiella aceris]MDR3433780.1 hypothetical protein [Rouxiella aceris]
MVKKNYPDTLKNRRVPTPFASTDVSLANNHMPETVAMKCSLSANILRPEYRKVLDFVNNNNILYGDDSSRPGAAIREFVETQMLKMAISSQARSLSPERLQKMLVESARPQRSYRNWQPDAELEQRSGMHAGSSRLTKT